MAKSKLSSATGFYIGYPFLWLIGWLPLWILYGVADFLFLIVITIGYRRKVITNNLNNSFPPWYYNTYQQKKYKKELN